MSTKFGADHTYEIKILDQANGPDARKLIMENNGFVFELVHDDMWGNAFIARSVESEPIIKQITYDLEKQVKKEHEKYIKTNYFDKNLSWKESGNAEYPYEITDSNGNLQIRINDFPEEPLYTLIINDEAVHDFNNWPENWIR